MMVDGGCRQIGSRRVFRGMRRRVASSTLTLNGSRRVLRGLQRRVVLADLAWNGSRRIRISRHAATDGPGDSSMEWVAADTYVAACSDGLIHRLLLIWNGSRRGVRGISAHLVRAKKSTKQPIAACREVPPRPIPLESQAGRFHCSSLITCI